MRTLLIIAVLLSSNALAEPSIPVNYNIVNAPRAGQETPFNVADWTPISALPGAACFTCHTEYLIYPDQAIDPVSYAYIQTAITGGQVRLVSFYYDASGVKQIDNTWATMTHPGGGGLPLQTANIAVKFNEYMREHGHTGVSFTMEVKGTGSLYMAKIYTGWKK